MSNTPDNKNLDEKVASGHEAEASASLQDFPDAPKSDEDKQAPAATSNEGAGLEGSRGVKEDYKALKPATRPGAVAVTPATSPATAVPGEVATRSYEAKMRRHQGNNNAAAPSPVKPGAVAVSAAPSSSAMPGAVAVSAAASRTSEAKMKMGQRPVRNHQEAASAVTPGAVAVSASANRSPSSTRKMSQLGTSFASQQPNTAAEASPGDSMAPCLRSEKMTARVAYPENEESTDSLPGAVAAVAQVSSVNVQSKKNEATTTAAGATAVAGFQGDSPYQTPDYTLDEQGTPQIVATLVDEEAAQHDENMVVAVAQKDSFMGLLRHDRRTRMIAGCFLVALIGLGVGLGVALSTAGDSSSGELEEAYLQAGSNIDGPDRFFEPGSGVGSKFGSSESLSGDGMFLAIGAPEYSSDEGDTIGLVQLFEEQDNDWALLETYLGGAAGDRMGTAVAASLDGNTVAIASPGFSEKRGQVQLYARSNSTWEPLGEAIVGESPGDELGTSVSIAENGRRIAVGLKGNATYTEFAKVFDYQADDWTLVGDDLEGHFGGNPVSLSPDGSTVAMSSLSTADNDFVGAIRVYEYDTDIWKRRGADVLLQGAAGNYDTGWSTSLSSDGKTMAIGSSVENAKAIEEYDLKVLIYRFDYEGSGNWTQQGETQHDKTGSHLIAYRVALSADAQVLAIGDPGGFAMGINSGHTHVLRWQDEEWFHITRELEGTDAADRFGDALSLSEDGNRISVGAPSSRATGAEVGRVQIFELADVE